jgi:hypothetical protein
MVLTRLFLFVMRAVFSVMSEKAMEAKVFVGTGSIAFLR